MGLVHSAYDTRENNEFLLLNQYSGEVTRVTIDRDKTGLYTDKSIFQKFPEACPFLREDKETGKACCVVHSTWPDICREFQCWRILIKGPSGERAGRVFQMRTLLTTDSGLEDIWERQAPIHAIEEDHLWEEEITRVLENEGYSVRK